MLVTDWLTTHFVAIGVCNLTSNFRTHRQVTLDCFLKNAISESAMWKIPFLTWEKSMFGIIFPPLHTLIALYRNFRQPVKLFAICVTHCRSQSRALSYGV